MGERGRQAAGQGERLVVGALERAFGGDPSARVFLRAALRTARLSAPPDEALALLEFVQRHLLSQLVGELGMEQTASLFVELAAEVRGLSLASPLDSGVQATPDANDAIEPAAVVASVSDSGRWRAPVAGPRVRVAVAYQAQFARMRLVRQLLQGHCDVVALSTRADIAAVTSFPSVAVVHLGHDNVELLLAGMVARRAELRVVAILAHTSVETAERLLTSSGVRHFEIVPSDALLSDVTLMVQWLAFG